MPPAANGDTLLIELQGALDTLGPVIINTRNYLTSVENLYSEDPIMMRDLLWRCLNAMATAEQHIERAEWHRKQHSARRLAALERERKKKIRDYHE
jgi:hypothetical protein